MTDAQLIEKEIVYAHLRLDISEVDPTMEAYIDSLLQSAIAVAGDFLNEDLSTAYTAATLPPTVRVAVLMIVATFFDNTTDFVVGRLVSELPLTVKKILEPHRKFPY